MGTGRVHTLRRLAHSAALVLALVLALPLAGCGGDDDAAPVAKPRSYRVGIDIPFHPLFNYVAARKLSYFGDKPYDVEFQVLDTTNLVPAFGTGKLSVIATFPSFLPRIEDRYGIRALEFFPLARIKHGLAIWIPADSPIRKLEDLKGATVAAPPIGQQWGEDEAMIMAATGQSIRDYFDVQESAAPVQQLLLGRVKAAFVGGEAVAEIAKDGGFRPLIDSSAIFERVYGDPLVLSGGLAASRAFLDGNPGFVEDLQAAFTDAWRRYADDPDTVLAVASKQSGLSPEQLAGFGEAVGLRETTEERRKITGSDIETWTQIYRVLARSGFLEDAPEDASPYFFTGPGARG